jgi:FtsH-binding integral membrane protein
MRLALSLRLWLYASAALLWASGIAWLFAHYFPSDRPYPAGLAATAMKIHGGTAMLLLVLAGVVVGLHVPGAWRERKNRVAGLVMAAALIGLVITGYLLYYAGGEIARALASAGHWLAGLALPVIGIWHGAAGRRSRRPSAQSSNWD